jgi:hypothetical protein
MPAIAIPDFGRVGRRGRYVGDEARRRGRDTRKGTAEFSLANIDLKKVDLSKVELPKVDTSKLDLSKVDLSKLDLSRLDLPARAEIVKQLRKASKEPFKRATEQLDKSLPTRRRSRTPFAIFGAIGGLFIGWMLATSPTARASIERGATSVRRTIGQWIDGMRSTGIEELETDLGAYPQPTGTAVASDTYAAAIGAQRPGAASTTLYGEEVTVPGGAAVEASAPGAQSGAGGIQTVAGAVEPAPGGLESDMSAGVSVGPGRREGLTPEAEV